LAARPDSAPIRFEADEACPPLIALVVGLQGAALVLAPTVLIVAITVRSSGLDDSYLTWGVFAALLINAVVTALQSFQAWRFGGGHVVISGPTMQFIGITVVAVSTAGPEILATLLVASCAIQVALAWWLPLLRRIVTPLVTGTVMILIAVTVLPLAFNNIQTLSADAPGAAGPTIAGITLLVSVVMTLRARGRWRLIAPFVSIVVGCLVTVGFGEFDARRIGEASWFGVPDVPELGFDLSFGNEFWALLPTFAILTLVVGLKTITDSVVIQQASRRRPSAIAAVGVSWARPSLTRDDLARDSMSQTEPRLNRKSRTSDGFPERRHNSLKKGHSWMPSRVCRDFHPITRIAIRLTVRDFTAFGRRKSP